MAATRCAAPVAEAPPAFNVLHAVTALHGCFPCTKASKQNMVACMVAARSQPQHRVSFENVGRKLVTPDDLAVFLRQLNAEKAAQLTPHAVLGMYVAAARQVWLPGQGLHVVRCAVFSSLLWDGRTLPHWPCCACYAAAQAGPHSADLGKAICSAVLETGGTGACSRTGCR